MIRSAGLRQISVNRGCSQTDSSNFGLLLHLSLLLFLLSTQATWHPSLAGKRQTNSLTEHPWLRAHASHSNLRSNDRSSCEAKSLFLFLFLFLCPSLCPQWHWRIDPAANWWMWTMQGRISHWRGSKATSWRLEVLPLETHDKRILLYILYKVVSFRSQEIFIKCLDFRSWTVRHNATCNTSPAILSSRIDMSMLFQVRALADGIWKVLQTIWGNDCTSGVQPWEYLLLSISPLHPWYIPIVGWFSL